MSADDETTPDETAVYGDGPAARGDSSERASSGRESVLDGASPSDGAGASDGQHAAPVPGPTGGRGPEGAETRIDGLDERVRAAESLPLGDRADAYRALHDELAGRLDASPGSP